MTPPNIRPLAHLKNALRDIGAVHHSIQAAITELHKTGPHSQKLLSILTTTGRLALALNRRIAALEKEKDPTTTHPTPAGKP
jgi:hypothetical protein